MKKPWILSYPLSATEKTDQTGRMPRLIWVFAGRTVTLLVLSCHGSFCMGKENLHHTGRKPYWPELAFQNQSTLKLSQDVRFTSSLNFRKWCFLYHMPNHVTLFPAKIAITWDPMSPLNQTDGAMVGLFTTKLSWNKSTEPLCFCLKRSIR